MNRIYKLFQIIVATHDRYGTRAVATESNNGDDDDNDEEDGNDDRDDNDDGGNRRSRYRRSLSNPDCTDRCGAYTSSERAKQKDGERKGERKGGRAERSSRNLFLCRILPRFFYVSARIGFARWNSKSLGHRCVRYPRGFGARRRRKVSLLLRFLTDVRRLIKRQSE